MLLHGTRRYIAAHPPYFVDAAAAAAAPRAMLLIRACAGEPPQELARLDRQQV